MKIVVFFPEGDNNYARNEEFYMDGPPGEIDKKLITEEVMKQYKDTWFSYDVWEGESNVKDFWLGTQTKN